MWISSRILGSQPSVRAGLVRLALEAYPSLRAVPSSLCAGAPQVLRNTELPLFTRLGIAPSRSRASMASSVGRN